MLVETVVGIWNVAHLRFSVLKADLLKRAHFVFGLVLQDKNSGSGETGRHQLENQSTNCLRLMLPGSTRQSIRPFKAVVERSATVTNSAWLGYQLGHLVTFPRAGVPSSYWSTSTPRSVWQRVLLKLLWVVESLGINALLTRTADAFGRGDNVVYALKKIDEAT